MAPALALRGHSGYDDDPVFDQVVADLARIVTARPEGHEPRGAADLS